MRIFAPLRHRPVAKLWAGQLLSSIGDEMSRIAAVWIAATTWGTKAGWLMALHAGSALMFSLAGGRWADRLNHRTTLVVSDLVRALAALLIPIGAAFGWSMATMLPLTLAVSGGFSVFFDPALRAMLPVVTPSPHLRGATTALIESTVRFARVLGPSLIAVASGLLPMVHFFTLDAGTYVLSALTVVWLSKDLPKSTTQAAQETTEREPWWRLLRGDPLLQYAIFSGAVVCAAWTLILPLGIGLVVHTRLPGEVAALGTVMAAYGVGNLTSNLLVGNFAERRPERLLFAGRVAAGVGFLLFAGATTPVGLMAGAALAAAGGPVTDVGLLGMMQGRFGPHALMRVYRGYLTLSHAGVFALFFVSPLLFDTFGIAPVIASSASIILAAGLWGLWRHAGARGRAWPTPTVTR